MTEGVRRPMPLATCLVPNWARAEAVMVDEKVRGF